MIGFVRGKLVVKAPPHLTVDVGGVGYDIEAVQAAMRAVGLPGFLVSRLSIGL